MPSYAALGAAVVLLLTVLYLRPNRYAKLPPGPPGIPVLGNLLQLPKHFAFLKFHEWSKQYGPIFSVNLAGQRVVVVNSVKTAADVLDRLSAHTSNRPPWIKINQFLSRGNIVISAQQGETWRRLRKATHEVLNIRNVAGFQGMQEQEAAIMVQGLVTCPNVDIIKHLHRASASIVWRALYGGPPLGLDGLGAPERVEQLTTYIFEAAIPGKSLMDVCPPLRHLYARSGWLRKPLDDWYHESSDIYLDLYKDAQDATVLGNACVSNNLSKLSNDYGVTETTKSWTAGALFVAGQDTTATTLRYFLVAVLVYPEVARKAQAQLDEVVGERLPTFQDKDRLPYISAIVKEVARWRPAAPGGLPHAASEDFVYNGYVIPRGTWVMDNIWSQARDEAVYSDPDKFDPSRFLDGEGQIRPGAPDTHDDWLGFGHGRRVCPGRDLAANSLFITFAYLLWAFTIRKGKDEYGKEVVIDDMDLVDNFVTVQPAPFKVDLVPRFKDLEAKLGGFL